VPHGSRPRSGSAPAPSRVPPGHPPTPRAPRAGDSCCGDRRARGRVRCRSHKGTDQCQRGPPTCSAPRDAHDRTIPPLPCGRRCRPYTAPMSWLMFSWMVMRVRRRALTQRPPGRDAPHSPRATHENERPNWLVCPAFFKTRRISSTTLHSVSGSSPRPRARTDSDVGRRSRVAARRLQSRGASARGPERLRRGAHHVPLDPHLGASAPRRRSSWLAGGRRWPRSRGALHDFLDLSAL